MILSDVVLENKEGMSFERSIGFPLLVDHSGVGGHCE